MGKKKKKGGLMGQLTGALDNPLVSAGLSLVPGGALIVAGAKTAAALSAGADKRKEARTEKAEEAEKAIDDELTKREFMPGREPQSVAPELQELENLETEAAEDAELFDSYGYDEDDFIPTS